MRRYGFVASLLTLVVALVVVATREVKSSAADAVVRLQPSTPGTQQVGNINISGTMKAGVFSGIGSGLSGVPWGAIVGAPSSYPPNGPAGGELSGNYPNPTLGLGSVKSSTILDGSVATVDLADAAVNSTKIQDGTIAEIDVADGAISSAKILDSTILGADIANGAVSNSKISDVAWAKITGAPTTLLQLPYLGSAGSAGPLFAVINTGPAGAIYGESTGTGYAIQAKSTGGLSGSTALYANASSATGATIGAQLWAQSADGIGVLGTGGAKGGSFVGQSASSYAVYGDGAAAGGWFQARNSTGTGVYGTGGAAGLTGSSASGYGVQATSTSNFGIYAYSAQSNGVHAESGNSTGLIAWAPGNNNAAYGYNLTSGTDGSFGSPNEGMLGRGRNGHDGVTANALDGGKGLVAVSSGGLSAFVIGDMQVTGSLSKAGGSFKIDHPLDPTNKYLYHSFVESPDMKNIYDGTITTDEAGRALVVLPPYFEALNADFRYQLTVIGQFAQAIIETKIKGNRFTIRTDKPNVEVCWQVTGIRIDPWAQKNRIPVEVDKSEGERGYYLHPEVYGLGDAQSVNRAYLQRLKTDYTPPGCRPSGTRAIRR